MISLPAMGSVLSVCDLGHYVRSIRLGMTLSQQVALMLPVMQEGRSVSRAYCTICEKGYQDDAVDKYHYYTQHPECAQAADKAGDQEAKKRGYSNYSEWFSKTPATETWEWEKTWKKNWKEQCNGL